MSASIAFIACSNGLGHTRRAILIADALARLGAKVTLFARKASVKYLLTVFGRKENFFIIDFDTFTSATSLENGHFESIYWEKRLPTDIYSFDIVVSDNLPEILAIRPDAWLSGNFLWHESLDRISIHYRRRAIALIAECRPKILTYGPFSIIEHLDDLEVVNCAIPQSSIKSKIKCPNALLIACGTGGNAKSLYQRFINGLSQNQISPFETVFVDPILLPEKPFAGMRKADFSPSMFSLVSAAICRPGFGIISECIAYGIPMFPVFESGNSEMKRNALLVESLRLGSACQTCEDALGTAINSYSDSETWSAYVHGLTQLKLSVETSAAEVLVTHESTLPPTPPSEK